MSMTSKSRCLYTFVSLSLSAHLPSHRRRIWTALAALSLAIGSSPAPALHGNEALITRALTTITTDEIKAHVDVLADDTFEGREAGSRGGRAAANYLTQYLTQGLAPAASDERYLQVFGAGYRNLLGKLEGNDPELKDEYILIGAHFDHVGYGNRQNSYGPFGYVHNGADDNASGTAAVLEVVNAFVESNLRCRRTILFALWDGEEKGLLGSEHWASNPTVPIKQIRLAINMDMVGRLRKGRVEVYGTRSMTGLRRLTSTANDFTQLNLDFLWEVKDNSDHYTFFRRHIPVLMFHTGLHSNYHRPSDDAHLVNSEGVREVANLAFNTVYLAANSPDLSRFRTAARREGTFDRRRFERQVAPLPARLGVAWNPELTEQGGLRVTRVVYGSAADNAGLRVGDRLLAFNGKTIDESAALQRWVVGAPTESTLTIQRESDEEPTEVELQLTGQPSRLGLTWREDSAEPGAVNVVRVVRHSPAALAGLRVNDRIYEVNQQTFQDRAEFLQTVESAEFPIELAIERAGRRSTITLKSIE
jgi:hypothetical protein